ncbi:hypothetical protein W97_01259 [Coniosporium apollinis CBS 100218]|uniref:Uncharacterized protein n=1 Tax=Coniosporium apollinis (strain CBS 100218) TaxID=1168221 RepID=R7YJG9_CONA1|nr:uncharacterized protein W97_01259 [Coniosporium apollinis CBS 100218]EON62040.1 hypothetical protein W97_01259 [Coniosporium apollinis CBS 100218]
MRLLEVRRQFFASSYRAVVVDDLPILAHPQEATIVGAAPRRGGSRRPGFVVKRQAKGEAQGLFDEVVIWFQNSIAALGKVTVKTTLTEQTTELFYNYSNAGPNPPVGLEWCSPINNPWVFCNATTGDIIPDVVTYHNETPDVSDIEVPSTVCITHDANALCPDATFSMLHAIGGAAVLHKAPNGNIYAFDEPVDRYNLSSFALQSSRLFSGKAHFVIGGSQGRLLHGYNDTLNSYGVSRIRLSRPSIMPNGSIPVTLVPMASPDGGPSIVVAMDTSANVYYLITCTMANSYAKVFLAKSMVDGPLALMDPGLMPTVTGGEITSCRVVPYTNGDRPA